jgi:hypothetical protein
MRIRCGLCVHEPRHSISRPFVIIRFNTIFQPFVINSDELRCDHLSPAIARTALGLVEFSLSLDDDCFRAL